MKYVEHRIIQRDKNEKNISKTPGNDTHTAYGQVSCLERTLNFVQPNQYALQYFTCDRRSTLQRSSASWSWKLTSVARACVLRGGEGGVSVGCQLR